MSRKRNTRRACVFILSHGRATNIITLRSLAKSGYTGDWRIVCDDEDSQLELYKATHGEQRIETFSKAAVLADVDTYDQKAGGRMGVILFARVAVQKIASDMGLTHYLVLDDDYTVFQYRIRADGTYWGVGITRRCDDVFALMYDFLDASGADSVGMLQGGDFIGGSGNPYAQTGLVRKLMNVFFCRTDRPLHFTGRINEDVNLYVGEGARGLLLLSTTHLSITQVTTQSSTGGMTGAYKVGGTYLKSLYTVVANPSCVANLYNRQRPCTAQVPPQRTLEQRRPENLVGRLVWIVCTLHDGNYRHTR